MKPKTIIRNRNHLMKEIYDEIKNNGQECSLNHLDVSNITNMSKTFFFYSDFKGDISEWDVSNVTNMDEMFYHSKFNGDISKWNVSKVETMNYMFNSSEFNGEISEWDISKVEKMDFIFSGSKFNKELTLWQPYSLLDLKKAFTNSSVKVPIYFYIDNLDYRKTQLDNSPVSLLRKLNKELPQHNVSPKKMKI
jgi:surface protein